MNIPRPGTLVQIPGGMFREAVLSPPCSGIADGWSTVMGVAVLTDAPGASRSTSQPPSVAKASASTCSPPRSGDRCGPVGYLGMGGTRGARSKILAVGRDPQADDWPRPASSMRGSRSARPDAREAGRGAPCGVGALGVLGRLVLQLDGRARAAYSRMRHDVVDADPAQLNLKLRPRN